MNQTRLFREAARPGQSQTETQLVTLKALTGQFGENPLIRHYANDPVIRTLELDVATIRKIRKWQCLRNPNCVCPLLWPHALLNLYPCTGMWALGKVGPAARAHKVILKKHCIEYIVDTYPAVGAAEGVMPTCPCCLGSAGGFHEVFPLSDVLEAGVQPCQAKACGGGPVAPDTFVVKTSSIAQGLVPSIAVDGPLDGSDFAAAVMRQKRRAEETSLPEDVQESYQQYMAGLSHLTPGHLMGGGLVGERIKPLVVQRQPGQMTAVQVSELAVPLVVQRQPGQMTRHTAPQGGNDKIAQLQQLKQLRDTGVLTDEAYAEAVTRAVDQSDDERPLKYNQVRPI